MSSICRGGGEDRNDRVSYRGSCRSTGRTLKLQIGTALAARHEQDFHSRHVLHILQMPKKPIVYFDIVFDSGEDHNRDAQDLLHMYYTWLWLWACAILLSRLIIPDHEAMWRLLFIRMSMAPWRIWTTSLHAMVQGSSDPYLEMPLGLFWQKLRRDGWEGAAQIVA